MFARIRPLSRPPHGGLLRALAATGLVGAAWLTPAPAPGAEVTETIDAADGDDPFDFRGEVDYRRKLRRAKITREFNCNPAIAEHYDTCPGAPPEGQLLHVKELRYTRVTHEIVPTARFGLWHDLELRIEAPIVIADEQEIRFAGDGGDPDSIAITENESSIDPAGEQALFNVPPDLPKRAGFGDMLFLIRFAPIAQERDDLRGDWTLEVGYRAPTGTIMKWNNKEVGRGVHELVFGTGLSRRFHFVDPYTHFQAVIPFASENSVFKDYGDAQKHVGPGARANFDFGAEVVPFEDEKRGVKFYLDLGLGVGYQAEGRDYSELFDALGGGGRQCDPNDNDVANPINDARGRYNCARYNPDSRSQVAGQPTDGITTVEQYMTFSGKLGMGVYVSRYAKLGANVALAHETEHYISTADVGEDLDGSGFVEPRRGPSGGMNPDWNPVEHNPTYVPAIDAIGRRIRVEETTVFTFGVNLSMVF